MAPHAGPGFFGNCRSGCNEPRTKLEMQITKGSRPAITGPRATRSDPFDPLFPKYPIPNLPFWMLFAPYAVNPFPSSLPGERAFALDLLPWCEKSGYRYSLTDPQALEMTMPTKTKKKSSKTSTKKRKRAAKPKAPQPTMKAAAIDRFGPPEVLTVHAFPVPKAGPKDVLIALHSAGVGIWDSEIRKGEYSVGRKKFPLVLGADGARRAEDENRVGRAQPEVIIDSL